MSAALQFPSLARAAAAQRNGRRVRRLETASRASTTDTHAGPDDTAPPLAPHGTARRTRRDLPSAPQRGTPAASLAFYRKHTETLLRRYLYASMLVGRAPSMLTEPLMRGWASHRPVQTFEDCVIFVLDMEKCLTRLSAFERLLITRIVLQEYTISETALLLNRSHRKICASFGDAIDRLTEILLESATLRIPDDGRRHEKDGDGED